jgi:integrase
VSSASATIKALGFLQGVFKRAVVRGKVSANPVREVDKPRQAGVRRAVPLAPETVETMRLTLEPDDAMVLTLLAYVGLRPEEAINAQVEHVHGTRLWVLARKVANHDRDVDLLPVVQADLQAWLLASGVRSGLVVPRSSGRAWTESDWRKRVYKPAALAAGVTGDLRPYRLRGSFASLLL